MTKATKRVIIVAVAFVVMAAIVLGMVAALTNGSTGGYNTTENGGMIMGESEGNGVALTSSVIAPEDYAANGVSALAESAYTVTATITPSNAVDKTVDWSVSWVNAESEFATGKTVTDYVTVTPESDGALTATVECKQAFGEQIVLTVSSRVVSGVSATCNIDYSKRITLVNYSYGSSDDLLKYSFEDPATSFEYVGGNYTAFNNELGITPIYSVYTIEDTFTYSYFVTFSESFVNAMRDQGFDTYDFDVAYNFNNLSKDYSSASDALFGVLVLKDSDAQSVVADKVFGSSGAYNKFSSAMRSLEGETLFTLNIICEGERSSFSGYCNFSAAISLYDINPSNISLDNSSIVF